MIRSSWLSKLACGAIILIAGYHVLDTIEVVGSVKVGDLEPSVQLNIVLEFLVLIAFAIRFVAISRIQYIPHFVFTASWIFCAVVGSIYFWTIYGGPAIYVDPRRIDILANWMWAFIVFSAVRFFVTAAMAYAISLDEFDTYS